MSTGQVNRLQYAFEDKTGPRHLVKRAPERQEPSSAWLGVEPQTDTTGSRNKHSYNMAFVGRQERERNTNRGEKSARSPFVETGRAQSTP